MNKRIILVGPSAAGKTFIRDKFKERGYSIDVSYTSREKRPGEEDGIDYKFISKEEFEKRIEQNLFYEYVSYNGNYYGTGLKEWNTSDIFVMESEGVTKIHTEDRKNCIIFYVNTPLSIRLERMKERGWDSEKILQRLKTDENFVNFNDYDLQISSVHHV